MDAVAFLILFLLIGLIIILIGVGIGFILSYLIPGLGIGMGIVAGAIFSVGTIDFWVRIFTSLHDLRDIYAEYADEDLKYENPCLIVPQKYWRSAVTNKKRRKTKKR